MWGMIGWAMELRHLRYFIAVAEELSFTRAAQKIRLAQPSLTRQIRNLEEEIGVRLINRSHNQVALTEEGKRFLFDAKKVLAMCTESIVAVRLMSQGESKQLNIGYVANLHYSLLPATLGAFRKLYPTVALNLFDMTRSEQYLAIESHKIDLGFVGLPPNLSDHNLLSESVAHAQQFEALDAHRIDLGFVGLRPALSGHDLVSECVAHDTMLVVLPALHPLAKKATIKLAELAPQFFVGMSPRLHPGKREWLIETCQHAGFTAQILQEAESEPAAIKFVADGLGVALLPDQITGLPHEGVALRQLSPPLRRESTIAWRADNPSKPLKDYIQIVKNLSRSI